MKVLKSMHVIKFFFFFRAYVASHLHYEIFWEPSSLSRDIHVGDSASKIYHYRRQVVSHTARTMVFVTLNAFLNEE